MRQNNFELRERVMDREWSDKALFPLGNRNGTVAIKGLMLARASSA